MISTPSSGTRILGCRLLNHLTWHWTRWASLGWEKRGSKTSLGAIVVIRFISDWEEVGPLRPRVVPVVQESRLDSKSTTMFPIFLTSLLSISFANVIQTWINLMSSFILTVSPKRCYSSPLSFTPRPILNVQLHQNVYCSSIMFTQSPHQR